MDQPLQCHVGSKSSVSQKSSGLAAMPGQRRALLLLICGFLLCTFGCRAAATKPAVDAGQTRIDPAAGINWWYARFRFDWPARTQPQWCLDALVADLVVEPVLTTYADRLPLWRFHRRARRDKSGHQFSFLFYTDRRTAAEIFQRLEHSPVWGRLQAAGMAREFKSDNPLLQKRPHIEDTSDTRWSAALQRAWPLYIKGVSAMWLELINQQVCGSPTADKDIAALIATYQAVDEAVSHIWREEGQHAMLHHLNAVFGYAPLKLRKSVVF